MNQFKSRYLEPYIAKLGERHYALCFKLMKAIPAFYCIENQLQNIRENYSGKVIESSSGTFGLGLAYACAKYDLDLTLVSDQICNIELTNKLKNLGVEVYICGESAQDKNIQLKRLDTLRKIQGSKACYWTKQYRNDNVPRSYESMETKIIDKSIFNNLSHIIFPVGSGGSSIGIYNWITNFLNIRPHKVAVDSDKSSLFGRKVEDRFLRGLGSSIEMPFVARSTFKRIYFIKDKYAFFLTRFLHKEHLIFMGPTSGASYAAGRHIIEDDNDAFVLSIFPDEGSRYLLTAYDPIWSNQISSETVDLNLDSIIPRLVSLDQSFEEGMAYYDC